MLNDARVASLGFFKNNVFTTRINEEKIFKLKFQVLLKFAQILLDYYSHTLIKLDSQINCGLIYAGAVFDFHL